jgi:hypothetical protein
MDMKKAVMILLSILALSPGMATYDFGANEWSGYWQGYDKRYGNWAAVSGVGETATCQAGVGILPKDLIQLRGEWKRVFRLHYGDVLILYPCDVVGWDDGM